MVLHEQPVKSSQLVILIDMFQIEWREGEKLISIQCFLCINNFFSISLVWSVEYCTSLMIELL